MIVAEVSSGTWNTVEATCTNARSDVVGDVVDVQLTKIITIGRDDALWSAHINQFVHRGQRIQSKYSDKSDKVNYTYCSDSGDSLWYTVWIYDVLDAANNRRNNWTIVAAIGCSDSCSDDRTVYSQCALHRLHKLGLVGALKQSITVSSAHPNVYKIVYICWSRLSVNFQP